MRCTNTTASAKRSLAIPYAGIVVIREVRLEPTRLVSLPS